jgi:hypothetical protein
MQVLTFCKYLTVTVRDYSVSLTRQERQNTPLQQAQGIMRNLITPISKAKGKALPVLNQVPRHKDVSCT